MEKRTRHDLEANPVIGLLTRTVIRSPIIRWIVPARIRHRSYNDVVFVGDDFIQVKQVTSGGHLTQVFYHDHFGSRICAADVFTVDASLTTDDIFSFDASISRLEDERLSPSQLLVLTLETQYILFIYLEQVARGRLAIRSQRLPLPQWPSVRQQVSQYLAVDPSSRAIAAAALEGHLVAYAVKSSSEICKEINGRLENWCPVKQIQPVALPGIIHQITFLQPARDDPENIILLAVVVDKKRTRLVWYDWRQSGKIELMQSHTIAVESPRCVPSLVIPLSYANFILVHDKTISICRDILSGSIDQISVEHIGADHPASLAGFSSRQPLWTNWCKPMRHQSTGTGRDFVYLAREDGQVFLLEVVDNSITASFAGDLQCYTGQAFGSLGNDLDPDLLAIAGEMSTGQIASIGDWSRATLQQVSRGSSMSMDVVELIPNWASVTDVLVSSHITARQYRRTYDSLVVCGGRQPHGTITELRRGIEAKIDMYIPLGDVRGIVSCCAFADHSDGSVVILLSTPESAVLFHLSAQTDNVSTVADSVLQVDATTLAAGNLAEYIVQITPAGITVSAGLYAEFDGYKHFKNAEGSFIHCAAVDTDSNLLAFSMATKDGCLVRVVSCHEGEDLLDTFEHAMLDDTPHDYHCLVQPVAIACASISGEIVIGITTEDNMIYLLSQRDNVLQTRAACAVPCEAHDRAESVALMFPLRLDDTIQASGLVQAKVVCGLRSGNVSSCTFSTGSDWALGEARLVSLGQEPVRLDAISSDRSRVIAFSGIETCLLNLKQEHAEELEVDSVWLSDKARPDLGQGKLAGYCKLPSRHNLPRERLIGTLAEHDIFVTASEICITRLETVADTVPRQIATSGSPNRLIFADAHRCWVSAAVESRLSITTTGEERRVYPTIDFISARDTSKRKTYSMQPGTEVYTLLEWTHMTEDNKMHSYILVGCAYMSNDIYKGKVYFLRPDMQREDTDVHVTSRPLAYGDPVYALALYDQMTILVGHGNRLVAQRFDSHERKWQQVCDSIVLSSRVVAISCPTAGVVVTTSRDGLVTMKLVELNEPAGAYSHTFKFTSTSPCAALGITSITTSLQAGDTSEISLMSTKDRRLIGTAHISDHLRLSNHPASASILFEARLKQSLIRLQRGHFRPSWRGDLPEGVLVDNFIGACADGSIVGLVVIAKRQWRRLFWLQRLLEWSVGGLGNACVYGIDEPNVIGERRELPIGLMASGQTQLMYSPHAHRNQGCDMHIDGDLLASVLGDDGEAVVHDALTLASQRNDAVGVWVREHMEEERSAVKMCVHEVTSMLTAWL